MKQSKQITYEHDTNWRTLELIPQTIATRLEELLQNAYAPYSNYPVSSIVVLDNGEVFVGTNQENAAFPSGMCAERVAVFAAQSAWPTTPISSIYIMTGETEREPAAPCGACRQVLHESEYRQKEPYDLYLLNRGDVLLRFKGVQDLLPLSFSLPTA